MSGSVSGFASVGAADVTLIMWVPLIIPVQQQIQGFAPDDLLSSEAVKATEQMMGVDSFVAAGRVNVLKPTTITLMAGSPSGPSFFDAWYEGQEALNLAAPAMGLLSSPSLGMAWNLVNGALDDYIPINDFKKLAQPRRFRVMWQRIQRFPIGSAG